MPDWLLSDNSLEVLVYPAGPRVYYSREDWDWQAELHDFDLWLCFEGRGTINVDGREHAVEPGSVFLFCPGQQVRGRSLPGCPVCNFGAHFRFGGSRSLEFMAGKVSRNLVLYRNLAEWCEGLYGALLDGRAAIRSHCVRDLLVRLWVDLERGDEPALERRVREQMKAIEAQPWREWRVASLAQTVGLSEPQLNRRWRQFAGTSPRRFVIRARCATAARLLRESSLSVQEIAHSLGYRDVYFFSRQFKREYGAAPSVYRAEARQTERDQSET